MRILKGSQKLNRLKLKVNLESFKIEMLKEMNNKCLKTNTWLTRMI